MTNSETHEPQEQPAHTPGCKRSDLPAAAWAPCAECDRIEALETFRLDALRRACEEVARIEPGRAVRESLRRLDEIVGRLPWEAL